MDIEYEKLISFTRLKEVIQEKGLKVKEVADMIGKNHNDISMVINGVRLPKTDFIAKLCFALKVSVDEICVFEGINPSGAQKDWYDKKGRLYTPDENAVGELTYRPLRRLLEVFLAEKNVGRDKPMTADDFFDMVDSAKRRNGNYDQSKKGIAKALEARGRTLGVKTETRARREYKEGLPYLTRTKLRQDRPLNIRTVYDLCKKLGCTPSWIMSYK